MKNKIKLTDFYIRLSIYLSSIFSPLLLSAQSTANQPSTYVISIPNPTSGIGANNLMTLLTAILQRVVMPVAAVLVVLWIIYAGFTFVTAQGKPAEIEKAKKRLLWSLVGAAILLGAEGISQVVQNTVNGLIQQ